MWDYTCKHTLAASNVLGCSKEAGSAAIAAEEIKRKKYSELAKENHYIPIAQETLVIVRSDEFNDRGKVGIKARSPQTSPWTKKIHLMFIKITLPNIGRRPRVIACRFISWKNKVALLPWTSFLLKLYFMQWSQMIFNDDSSARAMTTFSVKQRSHCLPPDESAYARALKFLTLLLVRAFESFMSKCMHAICQKVNKWLYT